MDLKKVYNNITHNFFFKTAKHHFFRSLFKLSFNKTIIIANTSWVPVDSLPLLDYISHKPYWILLIVTTLILSDTLSATALNRKTLEQFMDITFPSSFPCLMAVLHKNASNSKSFSSFLFGRMRPWIALVLCCKATADVSKKLLTVIQIKINMGFI